MIRFLLESFIFMLIGLELPDVAERGRTPAELAGYGRPPPSCRSTPSPGGSAIVRRRRGSRPDSSSAGGDFHRVDGHAGRRLAGHRLALPLRTATVEPFPARELIVFLTFAVIFDTLVLQGLARSRC